MKEMLFVALALAITTSAQAATIENDLFVCTGELIRYSANDYMSVSSAQKEKVAMAIAI